MTIIFVAAIAISGGAVYFFLTINPVHTDPSAVPSTLAAAPAERYSGSVEKARSLARALIVQQNLPGLVLVRKGTGFIDGGYLARGIFSLRWAAFHAKDARMMADCLSSSSDIRSGKSALV